MKRRVLAVIKKETKQLMRDRKMLFILFFFPVFLLVMFGYAVNFDVENIKTYVYDESNSKESRDLINEITATNYFDLSGYIRKYNNIKEVLDRGEAQLVIVIPKDYSKNLLNDSKKSKLQFLIDGVNSNTASIIQNYVNKIISDINLKNIKSNINLEVRYWFNPSLKTANYLVPGLIAMILIITSVISVSLTIVREKEENTIEQINISSLRGLELLLGKSVPYIIIALFNAVFILIASYFLFGVIIKGSYIELFLVTLLFIIASITLGLFVSFISDTQQVAFTIGTFISLLPSLILSGFIYPIESMPFMVQILTNITPAKFYIVALRAIILKGVALESYYNSVLALLIFGLFFALLSIVIRNKRRSLK